MSKGRSRRSFGPTPKEYNMETLQQVATSKRTALPTSDFMTYAEVHCQRNTQQRVGQTAKLLANNPSVRHLEVAVAEYPDGKRVVIDGNTRRLAWQTYSEQLDVPEFVIATIYPVKDQTEAEKLYETFDSSKAVETSKNKLYSAMRTIWGETYMNNLRSNPLKKGMLTTALRVSTEILKDAETDKPAKWRRDSIEDLRRTVYYYSKELKALDHLIMTPGTRDLNQGMYGAALIAMKKYGHDNPKLLDGLRKWFTGEWQPTASHYNGGKVDGICWMVRYSTGHSFYGPFIGQTAQNVLVLVMDLYLYCIDQFMNDKTIKTVNHLQILGYWKAYGKRNNLPLLRTKKQVARETILK